MKILGIDPGFGFFGFAVLDTDSREEIVEFGTFKTEKSDKKSGVYAADDNVARTRDIYRKLDDLFSVHRPAVMCTEAQSWPRSASSSLKVALFWGALVSICEVYRVPIVQVQPKDMKLAVAGSKSATKDSVKSVVVDRWPETARIMERRLESYPKGHIENIPPGEQVHAYDAAGVIIAAFDSELVQAIMTAEANIARRGA